MDAAARSDTAPVADRRSDTFGCAVKSANKLQRLLATANLLNTGSTANGLASGWFGTDGRDDVGSVRYGTNLYSTAKYRYAQQIQHSWPQIRLVSVAVRMVPDTRVRARAVRFRRRPVQTAGCGFTDGSDAVWPVRISGQTMARLKLRQYSSANIGNQNSWCNLSNINK